MEHEHGEQAPAGLRPSVDTEPPETLTEMLQLAVRCAHALLASDDARLAPDSGYWHRVDGVGAPCKLCLAGTVIHALAPAMVDNTLTPNSFPESWTRALCAVNAVRLGQWSVAANFVHMHRVRRGDALSLGTAFSRHMREAEGMVRPERSSWRERTGFAEHVRHLERRVLPAIERAERAVYGACSDGRDESKGGSDNE